MLMMLMMTYQSEHKFQHSGAETKKGPIEYMYATTLHPPRLANLSARTIEVILIQTRRKHKVSSNIQYMYL